MTTPNLTTSPAPGMQSAPDDATPKIRPMRLKPSAAHPWIVESETNIPGVYVEIARFSYRPMALMLASAPDLLATLVAILKDGCPLAIGLREMAGNAIAKATA